MKQSNNKIISEEQDENILREFLFKFLPYWPLFALLLIISLGAAWLYLHYTVPVYASTASILITDEKKGLDESKVFEMLDLFSSNKIVENEIEVLQSKTLARQVVKNLHLYAPVTVKSRLKESSAYEYSPIRVAAKSPDSIKNNGKKKEFTYIAGQVMIDGKKYPTGQWVSTPWDTLQFFVNKNFKPIQDEVTYHFSIIPVKKAATAILDRIIVEASGKQSTVINLIIRDESPKRGEDILNELIAAYNNAAIDDKNILASNTLQFVEDRLKFVVGELDSVEGQLQGFKARNNITDISTESRIFLETVSVNDQKISDLSVQLAALDQVERYVQGRKEKGIIAPATLGVADLVLTGLLEKLNSAELEYERIKKIVPESNPAAIALQDELQKIRPNILENIRGQRRNLEAGRLDLAATNSRYTSLLKTIPQKERALLDITRQQAIKNNIYTFLLQKREETALSYASTVPDSRLVDAAETGQIPVSPKRNLIYLIVVIGALALGTVFVNVRELLVNTIQSRNEIEKYTAIPIVGEVNFDKSGKKLVVAEGKSNYIAEQLRHLRTSLSYLSINKQHKKILVTSSVLSEGKSFITSNLGISLALAGKKVVMLELDLRKPKLCEAFGLSRKEGLSNYLIGRTDTAAIIRPTGIDNLFLIPSGPLPPNPSELLMNGRLKDLFADLEKDFDVILIDTTPVSPVTDAFIISPLCDATLYLIRQDYTPRQFVKKLDGLANGMGLHKPAIVYNGINEKGWRKYGYSFDYGYKYGYGEDKEE